MPRCRCRCRCNDQRRGKSAVANIYGLLRLKARLDVARRCGFRRDYTRFRTLNFAAALNIEMFGSEIRCEISRATACRRSAKCLSTSKARREAAYRQALRLSARSHAISNAKFRGRERISKFSVRNPLRIARNLTRHSMPTLRKLLQHLWDS